MVAAAYREPMLTMQTLTSIQKYRSKVYAYDNTCFVHTRDRRGITANAGNATQLALSTRREAVKLAVLDDVLSCIERYLNHPTHSWPACRVAVQ
jgi:hypothetical protein